MAAVPLVNAITNGRGLPASVMSGDWVFASFDLTALATAALFAMSAVYCAKHDEAAA